jgi:hypothetical protein
MARHSTQYDQKANPACRIFSGFGRLRLVVSGRFGLQEAIGCNRSDGSVESPGSRVLLVVVGKALPEPTELVRMLYPGQSSSPAEDTT